MTTKKSAREMAEEKFKEAERIGFKDTRLMAIWMYSQGGMDALRMLR